MEEEKKNSKGLYAIIVILCLLVLGLGGYIVYDKILSNTNKDVNTNDKDNNADKEKKDSQEDESTKKEYNFYEIGDKVTVKLNDSNESTFYVLKQSSQNEEYVTLFAEKSFGTSAFQEDYSDENEFEGSLIQSKLNELTSDWTNVKEKRLITVEEILATGLTSKKQCGPSESDICDSIKENSWLLNDSEEYWTMSKAVEDSVGSYPDNRYVYIVTLDGSITGYIVGYKPGSQWNEQGNFGNNMGIRPVIVISKEYIK